MHAKIKLTSRVLLISSAFNVDTNSLITHNDNKPNGISKQAVRVPCSLLSFSIALVGLLFLFSSCADQSNAWLTENQLNENINEIVNQIQEPVIPNDTINLIEFSGNQPDENGSVNFHPFIQQAIDSLSKNGGGTLLFAHTWGLKNWRKYSEIYRVKGPILLKSNIQLLFDPSIILQFEFDPRSYLPDGQGVIGRYEGSSIITYSGLIRAFNAKNIAIKAREGGSGAPPEIRGDGFKWQRWSWEGQLECKAAGEVQFYDRIREVNQQGLPLKERTFIDPEKDFFRPVTMEFYLCENVLVDGIKISESPFWSVHPVFSKNLIFRNMTFNTYGANNDGIDPESSKNILIERVVFGNQDDNIAIKSGRDLDGRDGTNIQGTILENIESEYIKNAKIGGPTENVVIRNCVFKGHYAICIGSEMSGSVRNVYAVNNSSVQKVKMGLFIKSSRKRGGIVENIYVYNLHLNEVEQDVICLIPNYDNDSVSEFPPKFRNIFINKVSANHAGNGIRLFGWYDSPVENVLIRNVEIGEVAKTPFRYSQAGGVHLENVEVGGKLYDGSYTILDENKKIPFQK